MPMDLRKSRSLCRPYYANPGHLGIVPLLLLTTEWDTSICLLERRLSQENQNLLVSRSQLMSLGDLEPTPRFSSTSVESRMPFVFTQSTIWRDFNPLSGVAYTRLVTGSIWILTQLPGHQPNP